MTNLPLLQSVLATPDDDLPRLVYADWLDEHGDAARAEFIRLQCAAAGLPTGDHRLVAMNERERELLARHAAGWCAPLGVTIDQCEFRRGFVDAVECHADLFVDGPEDLFRLTPVRRFHLRHAADRIDAIAACSRLERLHTLDLSGNALRDAGVAVLAASPHLGGLWCLDLSGCEVNTEGAERLAASAGVRGLRALRLAGCGIQADGLRAVLDSPFLAELTELDIRGNHQCWVHPSPDEPWVMLTEANVKGEGVRVLADSPAAGRFRRLDLSLNAIEDDTWDALVSSPHLTGLQSLTVFESEYQFTETVHEWDDTAATGYSVNEEISDVLSVSIPGGERRPVPRQPNDPRWTQPPCTISSEAVRRLHQRFGDRVRVTPPVVRYGALFSGTRPDWYGAKAPLVPREPTA